MKSKQILGRLGLALLLLGTLLVSACGGEGETGTQGFMDISWTRETPADTETIRFGSDGTFSYSCGCGNPVNDADLCEGYTYDPETGVITLRCLEVTEDMVTTIGLTAWDEDSLTLDFAGEERVFYPE